MRRIVDDGREVRQAAVVARFTALVLRESLTEVLQQHHAAVVDLVDAEVDTLEQIFLAEIVIATAAIVPF